MDGVTCTALPYVRASSVQPTRYHTRHAMNEYPLRALGVLATAKIASNARSVRSCCPGSDLTRAGSRMRARSCLGSDVRTVMLPISGGSRYRAYSSRSVPAWRGARASEPSANNLPCG